MLDSQELLESSGVAVSNDDANLIWTHNDSGGKPRLYLFDRRTGKQRGTYELQDVANTDWEDMSSFRSSERKFLAIGDTGDNSRKRKNIDICIIQEPFISNDGFSPDVVQKITTITTLEVQFPKGAIDCESLAFDPEHSRFILLTKEPLSCRLFSVPVDPTIFTDFSHRKLRMEAQYLQALTLSLITGADICPKTRQLVICNYGIGFLAQPSTTEPLLWDKKTLRKITLPKSKQCEAVAFIDPQQIVTTSEALPTPLWTTNLLKAQQKSQN